MRVGCTAPPTRLRERHGNTRCPQPSQRKEISKFILSEPIHWFFFSIIAQDREIHFSFFFFFFPPIFAIKERWSRHIIKTLGHQIKTKQLVATDGIFFCCYLHYTKRRTGKRETRKQNTKKAKKNPAKSKLYFIHNTNILGLVLPIILNSRNKSAGRRVPSRGLGQGAARRGLALRLLSRSV